MKHLLLILIVAFTLIGCEKNETQQTVTPSSSERKPDPLMSSTTQPVVIKPAADWNVVGDSAYYCGLTLLTWDAQPFNPDVYYILFEGTGNGSCTKQVVLNGITYYYPWTNSIDNFKALISGQICAAQPLTNYNVVVIYYKFQQGKWNLYNSMPVNISMGMAGYLCD